MQSQAWSAIASVVRGQDEKTSVSAAFNGAADNGRRGAMRKYSVPAIVAATVGVLLVVGGAAAATHYIITSTHQIKPSVLRQLRGHQGPRGFTGPQGAQGPAGVVPQVKNVDSETLTLQPGQDTFQVDPNNFQANCPAGYTVIGTGFNAGVGNADFVQSFGFFVGGFIHNDTSIPIHVHLQAICGVMPGGAVATSMRPSARATYRTMLRRVEARRR
jgi:hypothetical protein